MIRPHTLATGAAWLLIAGRSVTVWRRDGDGEWRCVVDIANGEPAA